MDKVIGPFHFLSVSPPWKAPMLKKNSMELPMDDTHFEKKNPWKTYG